MVPMVSVKSALGVLLIMQKRCLSHGHLKDETKPVKTESIGKHSQKKESKHKKVEKERKKPCQIPDSSVSSGPKKLGSNEKRHETNTHNSKEGFKSQPWSQMTKAFITIVCAHYIHKYCIIYTLY